MSEPFNLDASLSEGPVLAQRLQSIRGMHQVQHGNGNWNYSAYMLGLAMGLEMSLAVMEGRDPVFPPSLIEFLENRQPRAGVATAEHMPMAPEGPVALNPREGIGPWRTL